MRPSEALRHHREAVLQIARQHRVSELRVFGSVARGDDREDSDLDLLAAFEDGASLFDAFALQDDLESLLHHKVEVATEMGLHPRIRQQIMHEAKAL